MTLVCEGAAWSDPAEWEPYGEGSRGRGPIEEPHLPSWPFPCCVRKEGDKAECW